MKKSMAKKLVIIDEQALNRQRVRQAATSPHDTVLEFATSDEALKVLDAFQPDCVMLGVSCPPPNAFNAIRSIRKKLPEVRVLAVNSYSDAEAHQAATAAGASGYVTTHDLSQLFLLAAPDRIAAQPPRLKKKK
jgi:two-component system NarL family response regulator